jgi:predicted nucleic acid-binding protein
LIAVDTNILIYATSPEDGQGRTSAALELLNSLGTIRPILPLQVVGEYLNVARRHPEIDLADAVARIEVIMDVHRCEPSTAQDFLAAVEVSARFNLAYFDAVIVTVARRAGAALLMSEDMHDGLEVDGLRIVNPFVKTNNTLLADYFAKS